MKRICKRLTTLLSAGLVLMPAWVWASGEAAGNLVVVADSRRVSGFMKYFSDLYNTNIWLFAVWAVVLSAAMGCILGFLMDFLMSRSGLDLKSRKIVEH